MPCPTPFSLQPTALSLIPHALPLTPCALHPTFYTLFLRGVHLYVRPVHAAYTYYTYAYPHASCQHYAPPAPTLRTSHLKNAPRSYTAHRACTTLAPYDYAVRMRPTTYTYTYTYPTEYSTPYPIPYTLYPAHSNTTLILTPIGGAVGHVWNAEEKGERPRLEALL